MHKYFSARRAFGAVALTMLASTAFAEPVPLTLAPDGPTEVPELFQNGEARVAVVRFLNAGDVFQAWITGVEEEAERLGVQLEIYDANGDTARQALQLQQAVATGPDAILIGWGFGDSLGAGVEAACEAGIPVVTSNVDLVASDCVTNVNQSDKDMMRDILEVFTEDLDGNMEGDVIYVYVPGFQPLDLRDEVWQEFLAENPGINEVARIGVVNANTAAETANQAVAALQANPDTIAIVAPYDEFTKGATLAIQELGLEDSVKAYGMDFSTADISVMREENSPWVVTSSTDTLNYGRVGLRVAAGEIAGSYEGNDLLIPPQVVTQADLFEFDIRNMDDLRAAFPSLTTPELGRAPWMEAVE